MVNIFRRKPLPRTLETVYEDVNKAIEEVGSLDALTTTEKSSIVAAINELVTRITALESPEG